MQTRLQGEYARARDRTPTNAKRKATTTHANDDDSHATNRASRFWTGLRGMIHQPYLVANTALTTASGTSVIAILLAGGIATLAHKILSGDPTTQLLLNTSFTALLCGTMGMKMLADQREAAQEKTTKEMREAEFNELLQSLESAQKDTASVYDDILEQFDLLMAREKHSSYRRPNNLSAWDRYAPGTPFVSIDGGCVSEVQRVINADGDVLLKANREVLGKGWLPRFSGDTKLSSVDHILRSSHSEDGLPADRNRIYRLLGAYRVVRDLAEERGVETDLSIVRIALIDPSLWTDQSVFVGYKRSAGNMSAPIPMTQRYSVAPIPAAIQTNLMVDVSFSAEDAAGFRSCAEELIQNAYAVLNIDEAEARFGNNVPKFINGTNRPIRFSRPKRPDDAIDHYGEYYC